VPRVVQLGRQPDLVARHPRRPDALADLLLIAVGEGRVNVSVARPQRRRDRLLYLARLRFPCAQADGRDLVARVELVCLAGGVC